MSSVTIFSAFYVHMCVNGKIKDEFILNVWGLVFKLYEIKERKKRIPAPAPPLFFLYK